MTDILPCPWCDHDQLHVYGGGRPYVICLACGARGPYGESGAEAVAAWNSISSRPGPPLARYKSKVPAWANYITIDSHGYVIAWQQKPTQTQGGLFYSPSGYSVLAKPQFKPEMLNLLSTPNVEK